MRRLLFVMIAAALTLACSRQAATPEQLEAAHEAFTKAWDAAPSFEKKIHAAQEFLRQFKDSKYTVQVVRDTVHVFETDLGAPAEAEKFVRSVRKNVQDPTNKRELGIVHVELLGRLGQGSELAQVAAELEADDKLDFYDQVSVAEAAIAAKAWETAVRFADAAAKIDGPALQALSPPGRYPTAADLERGVRKRRAWALADRGWAEFQLGRHEEAFRTFELASTFDVRQIMGNSETSLPVFWGRALLAAGRANEAAEVVTANALYGGDREAEAVLEEAWKTQGGKGSFQDWVWQERQRRAILAPDFVLPDYEGTPRRLSSLRGAEVTLLAFWFPTCGGCRVELPRVEKLYRTYRSQGFNVIAVEALRDTARARKFIADKQLTFTCLENGTGDAEVVARLFGVGGFPTSFLLDREGKIMFSHLGFEKGNEAKMEAEILKLLAKR